MDLPPDAKIEKKPIYPEDDNASEKKLFEHRLVATKFFMPVASGKLISRHRLTTLLQKSFRYPLTLISAPAGFGKTTLLATWAQSLPADSPSRIWISLDEEDNDPRLFWAYILSGLQVQQPERFTPLLKELQSSQTPPLKSLLTVLINLLVESDQQFLLILDDYQVINKPQVHTSLLYLIEHLPDQLRIILATRADPPLQLLQLQTRGLLLKVYTEQLRCTAEETQAFFQEVIGLQLPYEVIQQVTTRTEGWLVGLRLVSLSLSEQTNPLTLLEAVSGDQRYILDYLTAEVLRRQPQDVRSFLLSTCILEQLTASLCNAVTEQDDSHQMLQRLEQANLFVVSLDSKRQWYRYHALFAEALYYQLKHMPDDLLHILHHRASLWYAQHDQSTQAILHAFRAHEWQWAADLIERKCLPLVAYTWGLGEHDLVLLREWLEQLPSDIVYSRPRLCLACAQLLWAVADPARIKAWLASAEAVLTARLTSQINENTCEPMLTPQARREQENLLGEVIAWCAVLQSYQAKAETILFLSQRAVALLSADNFVVRAHLVYAQMMAYYVSSTNDAVTAIASGYQSGSLARAATQPAFAIFAMGGTAAHMIGAGRLHEAYRLSQQAMALGIQPMGPMSPDAGWPAIFQADILREWNQLDVALSLVEEGISLCKQIASLTLLTCLLGGYAILLRVHLSRGDLEAACSALEEFERIGRNMNRPAYLHLQSYFTTVDQVRLWLACGKMERATRWAKELDVGKRDNMPFVFEREEVARVRILLATNQPDLALQKLEPVLQRATDGQRWGNVIEMRLLQALARQMHGEKTQALDTLAEAVHLAEPEGYICSFLDERAPIEALLYGLQKRDREQETTSYLDTLLLAFQQKNMARVRVQAGKYTQTQPLPNLLSEREREVLQILTRGASNQEIAQELVITVDTVKRHVSHIFSKLGVQNRVQAVKQARMIGLLGQEP